MGTKHKHYDVIIAWANGEEVEYLEEGVWYPMQPLVPPYYENNQYRIKPKRVKKEGWVNVYLSGHFQELGKIGTVYSTQHSAERGKGLGCTHCIRIEWEEEV